MLDCSALDWEPLEEFPEAGTLAAAAETSGRQPVWLALDEIGDPVSAPITASVVSSVVSVPCQCQCGVSVSVMSATVVSISMHNFLAD